MNSVIQIENLSKKYLLYHEGQAGDTTLVETLGRRGKKLWHTLTSPFTPARSPPAQTSAYEEFWALHDVSFSIQEGDRVGIIGRNGAGKSTLLKILSRITEPSSGTVKIKGRLSSLLEVGTGFHQELTGRENIYLNGAILGMKRNEIKRKFDEIVAFAEIEQFLDTPVKRYSSGMYMRLGFAIAAHLDSDLLIIDEVLAVGDTQFQAKCFKKLNELGNNGRTVLFVSHDLGSVLSLCNRGLYLEKGRVAASGSIDHCIDRYMKQYRDCALEWKGNVGDEHIRLYHASLAGNRQFFYQADKPQVTIDYEILRPHPDLFLSLSVWNLRNQRLAQAHTFDDIDHAHHFIAPGRRHLSFTLDANLFHEGEYLVKLHCAIFNKKKISDEEIVLKLPIYAQKKDTRFSHGKERDGVFLGNKWTWNAKDSNDPKNAETDAV